jgi:hypothetical protein
VTILFLYVASALDRVLLWEMVSGAFFSFFSDLRSS